MKGLTPIHASSLKFKQLLTWLFLIALITLSCLQLLTGYADNWDFTRSILFILERPADFPSILPPAAPEDWSLWERRFFSEWHDKWVFLEQWPQLEKISSISSYKLFLYGQAQFVSLFSPEAGYYSITFASIIPRIIILLSVLYLLSALRLKVPFYIVLVFAVFYSLIFLSTNWIALLNSFYEEQVAVFMFPFIALLLYKFFHAPKVTLFILILISITIVATAKRSFFYLPIMAIPLIYIIRAPLVTKASLVAVVMAAQILSIPHLFFNGTHDQEYKKINMYHSIYYGALKILTPQEIDTLETTTKQIIDRECIGKSAFEVPDCLKRTSTSYSDLGEIILKYPQTVYRTMMTVFDEGRNTELAYLGLGINSAPLFAKMKIFNIYPFIFKQHLNWGVVILTFLCIPFLLWRRNIGTTAPMALIKTGLFFSLFGFMQYPLVLADGFYEITKHLLIGNLAIAIAFVFLFAGLLARLHELMYPVPLIQEKVLA